MKKRACCYVLSFSLSLHKTGIIGTKVWTCVSMKMLFRGFVFCVKKFRLLHSWKLWSVFVTTTFNLLFYQQNWLTFWTSFSAFEEPQTSHEGCLLLRGAVRLRQAEGVPLAQPVPQHPAGHAPLPDIIRIRQRRGGEQQHRSGEITRKNCFHRIFSLAQLFQLI